MQTAIIYSSIGIMNRELIFFSRFVLDAHYEQSTEQSFPFAPQKSLLTQTSSQFNFRTTKVYFVCNFIHHCSVCNSIDCAIRFVLLKEQQQQQHTNFFRRCFACIMISPRNSFNSIRQ